MTSAELYLVLGTALVGLAAGALALLGDLDWIADAWRRRRKRKACGGYLWR